MIRKQASDTHVWIIGQKNIQSNITLEVPSSDSVTRCGCPPVPKDHMRETVMIHFFSRGFVGSGLALALIPTWLSTLYAGPADDELAAVPEISSPPGLSARDSSLHVHVA